MKDTAAGAGTSQQQANFIPAMEVQQWEEPTLKDVFTAISSCNSALAGLSMQVGSMQEQLSLMRQDIQKVNERTTVVEGKVSDIEDKLPPLSRNIQRHDQLIANLLSKSDDLENRLRRNNVRLIEVPEKFEGANPTDCFENWLMSVFGKKVLSPLYAVECAHWVPTWPLPPGAPPCPVLLCSAVLHYKDRDAILRAATKNPDIAINGQKIAYFPDGGELSSWI